MDSTGLPPTSQLPPRKGTARKWLTTLARWTIAVVGVWYVLSQMSFADKVQVATTQGVKQYTLAQPNATEDDASYRVVGVTSPIPRDDVLNARTGKKTETVQLSDGSKATVLGLDLRGNLAHNPTVARLYIEPTGKPAQWITPAQLAGPYVPKVPYPRVDVGLTSLLRKASQNNLWLLILAVIVFPLTYILTAVRWHELLKALDIRISLGLTFTLNMVGAFYNTFMPGSTGGDVLKAIYVSHLTEHRTRAVMSVLIDRIIGLLALIIIGGIAAATQWNVPQCRHIAIVSFILLAGTVLGLLIFYQPTLRKLFLLDFIINRMPKQKQVQNAVKVMEIYRRRPGLVFLSLVVTFPVHITVILSAMFAAMAFGLPLPASYYWAIVPVIVLVGSIPISPQGAGVMEYFAIKLTEARGATVSQAFALTMSIRLVQIFWNLTGAYFVLRGHFHKPTEADRTEFAQDLSDAHSAEPV